MTKPVIFTGLRANNDLHLGNYLGALLPIVDMAKNRSEDYEVNLMVADLHSFTTPIDHSKLQSQINQNLKVYVAAGLPLDSEDINIFRQSYVPAHAELTWILDCFTGMGEMGRMTQFKDKSSKLSEDRISVGLFNYPVLMAADYLLYGASYIPVGDDQSQHLEYGRDISERMNNNFGELFVIPKTVKEQHEFFGKDQGLRIKDLTNPQIKMSKSTDSNKGVIFLHDSTHEVKKKIMSATTDSLNSVKYDPQSQPGVSNLLEIYGLIKNKTVKESESEFAGQTQYGQFKQAVAEVVCDFIQNFQNDLAKVDEKIIKNKLEESEKRINSKANETLLKVQKAIGLR